jgi:hypothetical protein
MKKAIRRFMVSGVTLATAALLCSSQSNPDHIQKMASSIEDNVDVLPVKVNKAFKHGEVLTYRMHYGMINAGVAILEVKPDIIDVNGRKVYHVVGTGYTTGATDIFFKVRDRYESYMDKDALLPWMFVRRVDEGGYKFSQDYIFNHYTGKVDIGNNQKFDVPLGVQDMVSAFYAARNMDLSNAKEGDIYSLPCFVDKELWSMKIRYVGKDVIETDIGKFRALKFRPIVQRGRVFKKEEDLNVWISDDMNHIPLRVKANVLVGSIKMDITSVKNLANTPARVN